MKNNVVEIRNNFGMPIHVRMDVRKAVPMESSELNRLMLFTLVMGAVAGSLLTMVAVSLWESWR